MRNNIEAEHAAEYRGHSLKITVHFDDTGDAPWDNCDVHGPVSDWTRRDKRPGERVLNEDRGSRRFYDFAEAVRIAKRDGWGLGDKEKAELAKRLGRTPTAGDIVAEAVERDYAYLRGWCNDEWHYVGFTTEIETPDGRRVDGESVWGFDDAAYMVAEAMDCAKREVDRMLYVAEQTQIAACYP
jgi:hypothetical protein